MKARKFKIKIQSLVDFKNDFKKSWRAARQGKSLENEYDLVLSFSDIASLARVFSPQRVRLIQTVKNETPSSIRSLARLLKRAQPNVQRDVQDLAELGILVLKKTKKTGNKREALIPSCPWDEFDIAV